MDDVELTKAGSNELVYINIRLRELTTTHRFNNLISTSNHGSYSHRIDWSFTICEDFLGKVSRS